MIQFKIKNRKLFEKIFQVKTICQLIMHEKKDFTINAKESIYLIDHMRDLRIKEFFDLFKSFFDQNAFIKHTK